MKKYYFTFFFLLFYTVVSATEPFRFVLFSDLHIAMANPQASEDLMNAVRDVNSTRGVDFVLVDGDVSNLGDTASLIQARGILQNLNIPFYVLPGNHDILWDSPAAGNFNLVFHSDKFCFDHKGFRFIGFATAPLTRSGKAVVRKQDAWWIKKTLSQRKMPVFAVTHFPLATGDVDNWKAITDLLKKHDIRAVINGHYHRNVLLNFDGVPGIVCRSNLRSKTDEGGYTLFSVSDSMRVYEKKTGSPEELWLTLPLKTVKKQE
ncbi:MAG TPA: metallophosphoesterase [Paludibacter sp.]|nr:metallophosphoesterase [Paludibacter sp.]